MRICVREGLYGNDRQKRWTILELKDLQNKQDEEIYLIFHFCMIHILFSHLFSKFFELLHLNLGVFSV